MRWYTGVVRTAALYAKALQDAGIATLEIAMFPPRGRPKGVQFSMPHTAAALKWLAAQPSVDGNRLRATPAAASRPRRECEQFICYKTGQIKKSPRHAANRRLARLTDFSTLSLVRLR
jgi:hypothetical protein